MSNTRQPAIIIVNEKTQRIIDKYNESRSHELINSLIQLANKEKKREDNQEETSEGWGPWLLLKGVGMTFGQPIQTGVKGVMTLVKKYKEDIKNNNKNEIQYLGLDYIENLSALANLKYGTDWPQDMLNDQGIFEQEKNALEEAYKMLAEYEEYKRIKLNSWLYNPVGKAGEFLQERDEQSIDEGSLLIVSFLARKIREIYEFPLESRSLHYDHFCQFIKKLADEKIIKENSSLYKILNIIILNFKKCKLGTFIQEDLLMLPDNKDTSPINTAQENLKTACFSLLERTNNSLESNTLFLALANKEEYEGEYEGMDYFLNRLPLSVKKKKNNSAKEEFIKVYIEYVKNPKNVPTTEIVKQKLLTIKKNHSGMLGGKIGNKWGSLQPIFESEENIDLLAKLMMAEYEIQSVLKEIEKLPDVNENIDEESIKDRRGKLKALQSTLEYYYILHFRLANRLYPKPLSPYPNMDFYEDLRSIMHEKVVDFRNALIFYNPDIKDNDSDVRTKLLQKEVEWDKLRRQIEMHKESKRLVSSSQKENIQNNGENDIFSKVVIDESYREESKENKNEENYSDNITEEDVKYLECSFTQVEQEVKILQEKDQRICLEEENKKLKEEKKLYLGNQQNLPLNEELQIRVVKDPAALLEEAVKKFKDEMKKKSSSLKNSDAKEEILDKANLEFKKGWQHLTPEDSKEIRENFLEALETIYSDKQFGHQDKIKLLEHAKMLFLFKKHRPTSIFSGFELGRTASVEKIDQWLEQLNQSSKDKEFEFRWFGF